MAPHGWCPVSSTCCVHSRLCDSTRSFPFAWNALPPISSKWVNNHPWRPSSEAIPFPVPFPGSPESQSLCRGHHNAPHPALSRTESLLGLSGSRVHRIIWTACEQRRSLDFTPRDSIIGWGSIAEVALLQAPQMDLMEEKKTEHPGRDTAALTALSPALGTALSPNTVGAQ